MIEDDMIDPDQATHQIRRIVARWMTPDSKLKARDAMTEIAGVLINVSYEYEPQIIMERDPTAAELAIMRMAEPRLMFGDPQKVATGYSSLGADNLPAVTHESKVAELKGLLPKMVNKPIAWREGLLGDGTICNGSSPNEVGKLHSRADAQLVIAAVNYLPGLLARLDGAIKGERAADLEVQRLEGVVRELNAKMERHKAKELEGFDEARIDVIGQNGNDGEHYEAAPDPDWIEWDPSAGLDRPKNVVAVRYRDGTENESVAGANWAALRDGHEHMEIVAYRVR